MGPIALVIGSASATACADKAATPIVEESEVCDASDLTYSLGQDLGEADFGAEADAIPWLDRPSVIGPGVALADLNDDGWLDLAVATQLGSTWILVNDGTGALSADPALGVAGAGIPMAQTIAATELDGDGHLDLILGTIEGSPDLVLRADGTGGYTVTELPESTGHTTTASAADHDLDGDLDLIVTRYVVWPDFDEVQAGTIEGGGNVIYDNEGGSLVATERLPEAHRDDLSHQAQWVDIDADGDLDLYFSNDFGQYLDPNQLMLNDGTGSFSLADEDCSCQLGHEAMGVAVGDVDGSGTPDLYITDIGGSHLLVNEDGTHFYDSSKASGLHIALEPEHMVAWGTQAVDLDLDGDVDLPVTYGPLNFWDEDNLARFWDEDGEEFVDSLSQADVLYLGDGEGGFTDATSSSGFGDSDVGKALAVGDLDRDGAPDLVTAGWRGPGDPFVRTWLSAGACPGATVQLPLQATGARAQLDTGPSWWLTPSTTFSSSAPELYLGLPETDTATLTLTLPGGTVETYTLQRGTTLDLR